MAKNRPWYKRRGGAFVTATMHLPPIPRLCYSLIIDMLNDRDGPLPDNAAFIAGFCGISKQAWTAARKVLIADGKLILIGDGYISNPYFEDERAERMAEHELAVEAGRRGGLKSAAIRSGQMPELDLDRPKDGENIEETSQKHGNFSQSFAQAENEKAQNSAKEIQPPPQPSRARKSPEERVKTTTQTAARAPAPARDSDKPDKSQASLIDGRFYAVAQASGHHPRSPEAISAAKGFIQRWTDLEIDFDGIIIPTILEFMNKTDDPITSSLARFDRIITAKAAKAKAKPIGSSPPIPDPIFDFDDEPPIAAKLRKRIAHVIGPAKYHYLCMPNAANPKPISIKHSEHGSGQGMIAQINGPLASRLKDEVSQGHWTRFAQDLDLKDIF